MTKTFSRMLVTAALASVLLAAPASGQQNAAPPQQQTTKQPTPILRATSRLVELNVVVHDKKGNPITGLTRDDFVVKDEGRPQHISVFLEAKEQPPPSQPAPLPPNLFSNLRELRFGVPTNFTVILLDGVNTQFDDRAYARNQVIKLLRQIQPQDRVALYVLGREVHVLYDFTNDAATLVQALSRFKGVAPSAIDDPDLDLETYGFGLNTLNRLLEGANELAAQEATTQRVSLTVRAFEAIADHLAGLPGRKNLIWVSGGFPFFVGFQRLGRRDAPPFAQGRAYFEEVERAARALNRANLAVYPVDARGLVSPNLSDPRNPLLGVANMANIEAMSALAERTGGLAFFNTNDIKGAIRRAIDESRVNYVLGYYPENIKWDGKFRTLKVEVRKPGLEVRARRGYFALPDQSGDAKERRIELVKTAVGSLDATTIPLTAKAEPKKDTRARTVTFLMQVDPHPIQFEEREGRRVGAIDFFYLQRKPGGDIIKAADQTVNLQMLPATYAEVMRKGLYVSRDLDLEAGTTEVRIIVRDANSEALGSLTIPLEKVLPASDKQ